MVKNKFILIISLCFSILFNIPRITLLWNNASVGYLAPISWVDILYRCISVFGFSYLILEFNVFRWVKRSYSIRITLSVGVYVLWMILFRLFNHVLDLGTIMNPRFDGFIYLLILLMLMVVAHTMQLSHKSKIDALEKEQLKQEGLRNELMALKNQMDPHFLFNSLNSLSLLVREDQESAEKFIHKLSFLYRYILQSTESDLVHVKEEVRLLESYVYLIKQRFQDNFDVRINIEDRYEALMIPSLALQLLVENAVKHNEISKKNPLFVEIYTQTGFIIVKNKIHLRTGPIDSTGVGLVNLKSRFQLLKMKDITIVNDSDFFIVKLPIE